MADFYKGYFEDRYSFAHSDKKWYSQNKDHVKQYNHDYYLKHKKSFLYKDVDTTVDDPDQLLNDTEVGQIIKDQNGNYYVHASPQYYVTPDDQKRHYLSPFWSGEAGNNLASAIMYAAKYRNEDKLRKEYAKQDMDKLLDVLHRFGSGFHKRTAEESARKRQKAEAVMNKSRQNSKLHEKLNDERYKVKSRYLI